MYSGSCRYENENDFFVYICICTQISTLEKNNFLFVIACHKIFYWTIHRYPMEKYSVRGNVNESAPFVNTILIRKDLQE